MTHKELITRIENMYKGKTTKAYKRRSKLAVRRLREGFEQTQERSLLQFWYRVNLQLLEDIKRVKLNSLNR